MFLFSSSFLSVLSALLFKKTNAFLHTFVFLTEAENAEVFWKYSMPFNPAAPVPPGLESLTPFRVIRVVRG